MSDKGGGDFFAGFVLGAIAGAAAALLLTPASGEEFRQQLGERGAELKEQADKWAGEARSQAQNLAENTRGQVEQLQERGRIVLTENVKKAQQAVQDAQSKLAEAGDGAA